MLRFWQGWRDRHQWYECYGNPDDPDDPTMFVKVLRCRHCPKVLSPARAELLDIERKLWEWYACQLDHEHDRHCEDRTFWAVCYHMAHTYLKPLITAEREQIQCYPR